MSVLPVAKIDSAALVGAAGLLAAPHAAVPATRFQLTVRIIDRSGQQARPLDLQFLKVYVKDGSGNSESLTVIHAYGVR